MLLTHQLRVVDPQLYYQKYGSRSMSETQAGRTFTAGSDDSMDFKGSQGYVIRRGK